MPDYDAGTARARIRVDGDTRGADGATRAVEGFSRALEFIASRLGGFVASMDKIEAELNNVKGDFDDAAGAANKFDRAMDDVNLKNIKASRSTSDLGRNIEDLHKRLKFAHDAWADYGIPLAQAARAMNEFSRTRGGVVGAIQAVSRAGIAGAAVAAMKSHFIGMGLALRQAPAWQQNMARLAQNIGLVTLAGTRLGGVANLMTRGFARIVKDAEGADFAIAGFSGTINRAIRPVVDFFQTLDQVPTGLFKMAGGLAVAQSGLRNLAQRWTALSTIFGRGGGMMGQALRFFLLPGAILSTAAVQGLDVALRGLSNTMAGLWSGVKQLAGGFLAIPGAIAMIGAAALPMVAIVKTLSSNFKDLIKAVGDNDVEKFAEAMQKIPPYLRPLAQAVANAIQPIKSLGDVLTATFVSQGLDQQFTALVNTWLPAVSMGADTVANSWKILTNNLLQFLGQAQTISAVNTIFMHTSETMNAIGTSIGPVLSGLRDIAVVGSTFWRNLAEDYLPGIADKFQTWAANAAATGKAMAWMEGSVHAVKELYIGGKNAVQMIWQLLTLFQTKSGDSFLDRFANEMVKLNNQVRNSAASGELRKIADAVKGMGTNKLHELKQIFIDALPSITAFLHTLSEMSTAFSRIMLPTIEAVITAVGALAQGFNAIGGGTIVGTIWGLTKAFGLLSGAISTAWNVFKVFLGFTYFKTGAESVVIGLQGTLEKFGPVGRKASNAIAGIGDSLAGFIQKATLVGAAAFGVWEIYSQGAEEMKASGNAINDASKHSQEGLASLRNAFYSDLGTTGKSVIEQLAENTKQNMADLQNVTDKAPGVMSKVSDVLKQGFGNVGVAGLAISMFRGTSDELQNLQNKSNDAKSTLNATNDALRAMGASSQDLSKFVYGSNDAFARFSGELSKAGQSGAVEYWSKLREQFLGLQRDMEAAGPGAVMVANGIAKIAAAGGDAQSKLDGLKTALQGLGLLKQDAYEAAFNFAKAVEGLGDAAAKAADPSQALGQALLNTNGTLNTTAVNARNLYNVLQPVAETFLATAAKGGDVAGAYQRIDSQLGAVAQSFGLTKDQVVALTQQLGVVPQTVSILVQLQGKDADAQHLAQIVAEAQTSLNNTQPINIPIGVDAAHVRDMLNQMLNNPNAVGLSPDKNNIVLGVGIDQNAVNLLLQQLSSKYGIQAAGGPPVPAGAAAQMPVTPTAPAPAPAVPAPGNNQPPPSGSKQPQTLLPPGVTLPPGMGKNATPLAPTDVPGLLAAPPPAPPAAPAPPLPPALAPAPAPLPAPAAAAQAAPPVNIPVQITGMDQFGALQDAFKALTDTLNRNKDDWNAWRDSVNQAFQNILDSTRKVFDQITQQALDGGRKFSQNFAAGITDQAALQAISDAAIQAMQTAADKLPHSPAKEGPLSGQGWSGHSGSALAGDFAKGIEGGVGAVGDAASKLAGKVAGALKPATPYGLFGFKEEGEPFKDLKDALKIASDGLNLFKDVSDQTFKLIQFAQDPLGEKAKAKGGADSGLKTADTTPGGTAGGAPGGSNLYQDSAGNWHSRDPWWEGVMQAESGGQQAPTGNASHFGAFQFAQGTWDSVAKQVNPAWVGKNPGTAPMDVQAQMAQQLYNQNTGNLYGQWANPYVAAHPGGTSGQIWTPGATAAGPPGLKTPGSTGMFAANPASRASQVPNAPNVEAGIRQAGVAPLYAPGTTNLPPWMNQLAAAFGLTASTYPSGGSLHQMGFAADFNSPTGNTAQLEKFAQYISGNLASQTLQLIFQGAGGSKYGIASGKDVSGSGYYAGDYGGHTDHVHWATDVAPILAGANATAMPWAAGNLPQQQTAYGSQLKSAGAPGAEDPNMKYSGPTPGQQSQQVFDSTAGAAGEAQNQSQDMVSQISGAMSSATNVASSVMQTIQAGLEAWGATKYIMDQMVRGISDTEDLYNLVDQFQKYITFAADVANTVGQVLSAAGSGGGGDPSGASAMLGAAGQVAQMISAMLTTVNAAIDMGQEAYRMFGQYFGQFLGYLAGGPAGMMGNVHFLLDQNTGQLLAYSGDNPLNKNALNAPGYTPNPNANNQVIGQLNYYAGPGEDPRVGTRNMMYQVRASTLSTVTAQ